MTNELDTKLGQLKNLEDAIKKLADQKEAIRAEVFEQLEKEDLCQYKNDLATISTVERKTVKYLIKPEELIEKLPEQYITVIPEHKEIAPEFVAAVKNGNKFEGVELETKESLTIRFK